MTEIERCEICGEPATRHLGKREFPLCDNIVCEVAAVEQINLVLGIIAEEKKKKGE